MWDNLKASIASVVRTNNNQEITGANLQNVLNTIVNTVGANATFAGIAVPSTNPGTPDGPVFYIACEPGVYSNFNLTLVDGLYILENKTGSWVGTQINTGAAFEALIGYYNAVLNGASITVPDAMTYRLTVGGDFKLKMSAPGTTATTLTIGNATDIPIWYNGAAVSSDNTWEAGEIISVFYDGTRFMASNSQGSGGNGGSVSFLTGTEKPNINSNTGTITFSASNLIVGKNRYVIPAQTVNLYDSSMALGIAKNCVLVANFKTGVISGRFVAQAPNPQSEVSLGIYCIDYIVNEAAQATYWTVVKENSFIFDYTIDGFDYLSEGHEYERKYLADLQTTHGSYVTDIKGFMSLKVKTSQDGSGSATRIWVIIPAYKVAKVRVNTLPSSYNWTFNAFAERAYAIGRFSDSLDNGIIGWRNAGESGKLSYPTFRYLKLAFRKTNNGEITVADWNAIMQSLNIEVWTGTAVDEYYQRLDIADADLYGQRITDVSGYEHVLAKGSKTNDRLRFFIPIKNDATVTVNSLLSGFDWTINAFKSYEDAVNTVAPLDGGSLPWTSQPGTYTLSYGAMNWMRLNFKKTVNNTITSQEVANIIASLDIVIRGNSQNAIKKTVESLSENIAKRIDLASTYLCDIKNTNWGDYNLLAQIFRISPNSVLTLKCKVEEPTVTTHIDIGNDDLMYDWSKRIYKDLWTLGDKTVSNESYNGRIAVVMFKKGTSVSGSISEPCTIEDVLAEYDLYISGFMDWEFNNNLTAALGARASAHRGVYVNDIPQESNEAYMIAARCGFDECEADVCVTSDGKFIMSHDTTLSSTLIEYADGTQLSSAVAINSLTFDEIRTNYRLKSNNPIYRQQIPSFEEYLKICQQYNMFAFPEIKNNPLSNELCASFLELCESYLDKSQFAIQSWNYAALDYIRSLDEDVDLCYVDIDIRNTTNAVTGQNRFTPHTHTMLRETGSRITLLSAEIVQAYRRNGSMVWDGTLVRPNMVSDTIQNNDNPTVITETCGPNLLGRNGIHLNSKKGWGWFYTNGTVSDGVVTLATGQVLAFTTRFAYIGGIILDIKFMGAITIKSQQANTNIGLNKTVTSTSAYKHLLERVLVYNNTGSFYIIATANTIIENIDFQYTELV